MYCGLYWNQHKLQNQDYYMMIQDNSHLANRSLLTALSIHHLRSKHSSSSSCDQNLLCIFQNDKQNSHWIPTPKFCPRHMSNTQIQKFGHLRLSICPPHSQCRHWSLSLPSTFQQHSRCIAGLQLQSTCRQHNLDMLLKCLRRR